MSLVNNIFVPILSAFLGAAVIWITVIVLKGKNRP